ncbi:GntR family transcriptional regulator [Aquabacterium sp.]|uniref:GntR family transcriptional regulator n=1 Tax=Aquabacterium sp. TaxID=1872578 RepID=UPI002B978553|nr:GntR family transcriptional regulator [Aquabacterium sp.]HSW07943.1 GntR family transcriptional regulator [Aquabacterium sp.]
MPPPASLPLKAVIARRDRSRQAAPQVFEQLRELIVSLQLTPGTVLSRAELAEQFALSQTPIRDALLKLGEEGLVDIFPQHATVVSRIDVGSARQAHFLRRSIESEVVRTLAGVASIELIARLRTQIDVQAALMGEQSLREFIAADQAFHRLMYEAAGVPDLFDLVRQRSGHVDRLRLLHLPSAGKERAIVRDHRRIVDAVAAGDAEAAQSGLRDHLSDTLSKIDEIRTRFPEYLTG